MDVERALIGKALQAGQLDDLVARGIEPFHFASRECQEVYEGCLQHLGSYQVPPTVEVIQREFPDFTVNFTQTSIEYLTDEFVKKVKRRKAIELGDAYAEAIDDPAQVGSIEDVAMEMAATLMDVVPQPRVGRFSDEERRIQDYLRRRDEEGIWGLRTGFATIDHITTGIQAQELAVVVAWQGIGKSWFMQHWAWNMYMHGHTPLFISLEMSEEEIFERWTTMATHVAHHALRICELPDADIEKWREVAARAKDARAERDIIVIDDIGSCTPDRVLAETRRYKPDAVFVDYIELMDPPRRIDGGGWQELNEIGKDLKRNARVLGIPVIVAAQTNVGGSGGDGPLLSNISYKSHGKHANLIFGVHRDEEMERAREAQIRLLKNRNGKKVWIDAIWDLDKGDIREKSASEYMRVRNASIA